MGHQFPRAALATAIALSAGACGGSAGDAEPPLVLDNARDQVTSVASSGSAGESTAPPTENSSVAAAPAELPPPDRSTFEGANRVVNLWVGADGETSAVDVWGRRTFTNGPILLGEDVAFGESSDYFSAPSGYDLVVVGTGAGPDGEQRAAVFNATVGEQITTVFTNEDEDGAVLAQNLFERGADDAPLPPVEGSGLIVVIAPNMGAFSDDTTVFVGADGFAVGDGSTDCRTQRIESEGLPPFVLGGPDAVELDVPPGEAVLSFHPRSPAACDSASVLEVTVDIAAGQTMLVLMYSPDGVSVAALTLPVAPLSG